MEKCVCGYISAQPWEKEFDETITDEMINNEDFISLEGSFYKKSSGYFGYVVEVSLHVCPKCGTVRVAN